MMKHLSLFALMMCACSSPSSRPPVLEDPSPVAPAGGNVPEPMMLSGTKDASADSNAIVDSGHMTQPDGNPNPILGTTTISCQGRLAMPIAGRFILYTYNVSTDDTTGDATVYAEFRSDDDSGAPCVATVNDPGPDAGTDDITVSCSPTTGFLAHLVKPANTVHVDLTGGANLSWDEVGDCTVTH